MHTYGGTLLRRWFAVVLLLVLMIVPTGSVMAVAPTYTSVQTLAGTAAGDIFGTSVAVSRDNTTAVIGAPGKNGSAGAVYIYTRNGAGTWIQQQAITTLTIPTPPPIIDQIAAGNNFGFFVATSTDGSSILVGAPFANGSRGRAYVFETTNHTAWSVKREFTPGTLVGSSAENFGHSVALSADGTTVLIGAPKADTGITPATANVGVAYAYLRNGSSWSNLPSSQGPFTSGSPTTLDDYGSAVALSDDGKTALIGADQANHMGANSFDENGKAFVYTRAATLPFSGETNLPQSNPDPTGLTCQGDNFGFSVALSGDGKTALISAPYHFVPGVGGGCDPPNYTGIQSGSAYVFTIGGGTPLEIDEDNTAFRSTNDLFGQSVALSGDGLTAVIGAINYGQTGNPGAAWAYNRPNATAAFVAFAQRPITSSDAAPANGDAFGYSVALPQTGGHVIVGEFARNVNQGEAIDFALSPPDLTPAGPALPNGAVGTAYSQQFTASNGAGGPYTFALVGTPPPGLMFSTTTGLLSGTPTTAGNDRFSVSATDKANGTTTQPYTLTITPGATTTTVTSFSIPFSATAQNVTLNAAVVNAVPVNEGTVTFTLPIGTAPAPVSVVNGTASAPFVVPANTPAGAYTITATYTPPVTTPDYLTSTGTGTLTVTAAAVTLTSIAVTPVNPSIAIGATQQFKAIGTYSNSTTADITSTVTWASGTSAVATITTGGATAGLATGVSAGTATISASLSGVTGATTLTVTAPGVTLTSIAVTPVNPSIAIGATQQFKATGTYSNSTTADITSTVTWASGTSAVATITTGGATAGLATGVSAGTTTISATLSGVSGTTTLTVTAVGPPPAAGLQYYPLATPVRLLDTRPGATAFLHPGKPLTAGQSLTLPGQFSYNGVTVPAAAQAVVGNATVDNSVGAPAGFATLHPDRSTPTTSNLNFLPGTVRPNAFIATLAADGTFTLFSSTGGDFIIDIAGYYAPVGAGGLYFHPLAAPVRELDTRVGYTAFVHPNATLTAGQTLNLPGAFSYNGMTIPAGAKALVGNATVANAVNKTPAGFATLYPNGVPLPLASDLNYVAGTVAPNAFTVALGGDGTYNLYASSGGDFVIDITGYLDTVAAGGLLYTPLATPVRELDTRVGNTALVHPNATLTAGQTLNLPGSFSYSGVTVPASAQALVGNATVANDGNGTPAGFATVYPGGKSLPLASNLNFVAKQVAPNEVIVGVGGDGTYNLYSSTGGDFVIDISGYFAAPGGAAPKPATAPAKASVPTATLTATKPSK